MKLAVILVFAGLSTATPAIVEDTRNSAGEEATHTVVKPFFLTTILSPNPGWSNEVPFRSDSSEHSYRLQHRAEPAEGSAESKEDEDDDPVTLTFIGGESHIRSTTTSTPTSVSKSTKAKTQATVTRTVTSTSVVASAKATSSGLTSSSPDKPRSDAEVEVDDDLDDDLKEFMNLDWYSRLAQEEEAPSSYEQAFKNQNAIAFHQAIQTERLAGYDATECAEYCNRHRACEAFGIFVERQPPCTSCSFRRSNKLFMCKLYNIHLEPRIVTDKGNEQILGGKKFTLAIRASNGYNRLGRAATVTVTTTRAIVSVFSAPHEIKTITTTRISFAPRRTVTKIIATSITTTVMSTQQAAARETIIVNAIANTITSTLTTTELNTETITKTSTTTVAAQPTHSDLDLDPNDESARKPKTQYWRS